MPTNAFIILWEYYSPLKDSSVMSGARPGHQDQYYVWLRASLITIYLTLIQPRVFISRADVRIKMEILPTPLVSPSRREGGVYPSNCHPTKYNPLLIPLLQYRGAITRWDNHWFYTNIYLNLVPKLTFNVRRINVCTSAKSFPPLKQHCCESDCSWRHWLIVLVVTLWDPENTQVKRLKFIPAIHKMSSSKDVLIQFQVP